MDKIIGIYLILIGIFALVLLLLLYLWKRRMGYREAYGIYRGKGTVTRQDYLLVVYDFCSRLIFTRRLLKRLTDRYGIFYPGNNSRIKKKAICLAIRMWVLYSILIIVFILSGRSWDSILLMIFYLYGAGNAIVLYEENREKRKLLTQFDGFLTEVRLDYQVHGMIDEAVYEAGENQMEPMRLHAGCIYRILSDTEEGDKKEEYNKHVPNRFLKTFLALCLILNAYGDVKVKEQSLFLLNIRFLRQEIHMEVLKRDKIRHLFSGLVLVAVFPVLFLQVIEEWAVDNLPSLTHFYSGTPGIILKAVIFLLTFFSYQLLVAMKEERLAYPWDSTILRAISRQRTAGVLLDKILFLNYGKLTRMQNSLKLQGGTSALKQFLLKRILLGIAGFLLCILLFFTVHEADKQLNLQEADISRGSSAISAEKAKELAESITVYTRKFLRGGMSLEEVENAIGSEKRISEKYLQRVAAEEVYARIQTIRNEYFKWYELVIALLVSWGFSYIPHGTLLLFKKVREREMEEEVFSYQSILLILMYVKRMDVLTVLEWMEAFARIFKDSIRECVRTLAEGEQEALEKLKEKEVFKPFRKIVEELQSSDTVGLEKAFSDVEQERANYLEKRILDDEISIREKAILGHTIAFIPFVLTVGLYIVLPFVAEGLRMYKVYMEQLGGMG